MVKINLPHNSWAYENFISDEEKDQLIDWMQSHFHLTKNNGFGRYFRDQIQKESDLPDVYVTVKRRIIETDNLKELDPFFGDFISFNFEGAAIHEHNDRNLENKIHTRYNLLLSLPETGGNPIYGGEILEVKEKMIWRCEAGKYKHASLPVKGSKPRLNISFGFQV